jgi:hypothetical protein
LETCFRTFSKQLVVSIGEFTVDFVKKITSQKPQSKNFIDLGWG